jgi:hypothetical protein
MADVMKKSSQLNRQRMPLNIRALRGVRHLS